MLNADIKEFEFTSEFDELSVSAVLAVPMGEKSGVVQIIHGLNEHKERYYPFMDYLAEQGFITIIHDCRGHGKSICTEDDLGFMFKNGADGFVSDIANLNKRIRNGYPDLPVFMIGHGIGSAGVRCFIKNNDDLLDGIILLGTPCFGRFSSVVRTINSVSSKNPGSRFRSDKIAEAIDRAFGKSFPAENNAWRCSDPDAVKEFNEDPLCSFNPTLNAYEEMLAMISKADSNGGRTVNNPSLPIRFISGRDDPAMGSERLFFKVMKNLEKAGYESISHRLFDGMRHDVLHEKNSINVYKDIVKTLFSWVDRFNNND